jgi:dimethylhistidine N-methyltransferase
VTNLKLININNQIQDDKKLILQGLLNKKQKYLLPKYFYDEKGSKLFNKITNLKEYYPTNKELEILGSLQKEIRKKLPINSTIVEFGSGSNKKINKFINSLTYPKEYIPIDISKEYLFENASIIAKKFSDLKVTAICADFSQTNRLNKILKNKKKIVSFFPGSTIGNYLPKNAKKILKNFSKIIGKNSYLVIGVDLIKNKRTLENAYNDKLGVTAKFNKNILNVVNKICNSNFQTKNFDHKAFYNLNKNRIEMHLISKKNFTLKINKKNIKFTKNETIHTENSHKYSKKNFIELVNKSGFKVLKHFTDKKNYFGVFLLKVK